MSHDRRNIAVRVLVALIAVLLPAGVVAATAADRPSSSAASPDGRVGAAGFDLDGIADERATRREATVTVVTTSATVPPSTTTTSGPRTATRTPTTSTPPPRGSTVYTLPAGAPPPGPPPTGIANIAPTSSWSADNAGVSVRMRMEPAAPVAGQTVTFRIDTSSAEPCCTVMLAFGDGANFEANNGVPCSAMSSGPHSTVATHVYAGPGSYKLQLSAMAAFTCGAAPIGPEGPPVPVIHAASITACAGIGPAAAAARGCSPFPDFGPDDIVSPVIDPFCQIRSDCTQASKPR